MGIARASGRKLARAIEGVVAHMDRNIGLRLDGEDDLDRRRRDSALCDELVWVVESLIRDRKLLEHLEYSQAMRLAYQYTLTLTADSISMGNPAKRAEPSLCLGRLGGAQGINNYFPTY